MSRRWLAAVCLCGLFGVTGQVEAQRPPRDLHKVGDHWTAWDPPFSFPEGTEVYVIVRDDTLWDLAERYYGDPYQWPQLWEANPYILDAHWIYPGDPLVIGPKVTQLEDLAHLQELAEEEVVPDPDAIFDRGQGPPVALGNESDVYCSGFIASPERSFPYAIMGSEHQSLGPTLTASRSKRRLSGGLYRGRSATPTAKVGLTAGDIVYLGGGRDSGLIPGSQFNAVEPAELVRHPETDRELGRLYRHLGRVRILSVQESRAIAEIAHSCRPIQIGAVLEPFEPVPVPLRRRTPLRGVNDPESWERLANGASIVLANDDVISLGQHHLVYIDRGLDDRVSPGDMYTIYRRSAAGLPPVVIGELAVLAVHERSSLARILESRYAVYVGDRVSPKTQ